MHQDLRERFEGAASLLVGLSLDDQLPFATRGWGFDRDPTHPHRGRLLLSEADLALLGLTSGATPGFGLAFTAMEADTLDAVQAKGRLLEVGPSSRGAQIRKDRYCDEFIEKVVHTGWYERELVGRWRPGRVLPCTVELTSFYNQHPGEREGEDRGRLLGETSG